MPRMFRLVCALVCLTIIASALPCIAAAYTIQAGDTPAGIAKKHGISVEDLLKANKNLKPNKMQVGQTLAIPGAAAEKPAKDDKKHPDKEPRQDKSRKAEASAPEPAAKSSAKAATHVVKKGETLGEIASKLGVSVEDLLKANKGLDPRRVKIGQELTVPGAAKAEKTEKAEPAAKTSTKAEKEKSSAESKERTVTYTAHKRDTPESVARKFHISVKELSRLNPDLGSKIHSGQKLSVPASKSRNAAEDLPETEPEAAPPATSRPAKAPEAELPPATVPETPPAKPTRTPAVESATPSLPETKDVAEAEAQFEKGIEFGKQNKFPKAVESFDKAIKLNPNRADYYASRGHANYYMKQYAKAIDDYTRAIEKNPNFALAYSMRGLSRTRSGRYPQAIEDFNKAIALGPNEADYYKGRGFTYLHLKQPGPMCQDYKKACDLGDCELLESARKEKACP